MSKHAIVLPDTRTHLTPTGAGIQGWACVTCGHRISLPGPWCPKCRGALNAVDLGRTGVVWASTVLRVPLPGRTPPMSLAYVDLDSGPRVLAHIAGDGDQPVTVGTPVVLVGQSPEGDIEFAAATDAQEGTEIV